MVLGSEAPGSGREAGVEAVPSNWPVRSMKRSLQRRKGFPPSAGQEGAEPVWIWRRPWKPPGILERVVMDPPA